MTNTQRAIVIQVHTAGHTPTLSLHAAAADGSSSGAAASWTLAGNGRQRRDSIRVAARLHLTQLSAPGVYRMPLHVEVTPL